MVLYNLRMALKSFRRNPVLSGLMVGGIGLGIGVSTAFVTAFYIFSMDPIPEKSDVLFYVEIDNWDPNRPWDDDDPSAVPTQITYRDMVGLMASEIPTYQGGSFKASLFIHPDPEIARPYKVLARMCFADFFQLFEPPFEFGSGWDRNADQGLEPVVVLDHETNQKLFGGEDSVGRMVRIEEREFKVVGVLKPWRPFPKYYDPHNGDYEKPEQIYMPLEFFQAMDFRTSGNTSNWSTFDWDDDEQYLASEAIWIQFWVQLDSPDQKEAYMSFLNSYTDGQRQLGRMQRPNNNKLLNVMEWLDDREVVPEEATSLMIISLLFLVVCALNLIGILLGKFLARAPEVSVRRALGASRLSVFFQHIVECETVGIIGGFLGIGLAVIGLHIVNSLFPGETFEFALDTNMLIAAILLSLVAGLIAGLYPAWRICSIPPASYLKEQ